MNKFLLNSLILALMMTAGVSILGYFGQNSWVLDLFSHFKFQYFLVLTLGGLVIFFTRRKLTLIFLPFIALLLMELGPLYFGGNTNAVTTETVKIICINLLSSNDRKEDVANYINQKNPDIIVFQEVTNQWQSMLEPILDHYPFRITLPRADNFGIAMYSKLPMTELEVLQFGSADLPSIKGVMVLAGSPVTLIATHPLPPINSQYFNERNNQLIDLGKHISHLKNDVIVIGDLNTSSFSTHFKQLISATELRDSRKGFGLHTTWSTWLGMLRTTLDHCLVSKRIIVKSREVGENIGSDHLPIYLMLGIE